MELPDLLYEATYFVLYIFFGPHTLVFLIISWWIDNYDRKARNALYHRVGVPCTGVVTHRKFDSDGTMMFRYAYRAQKNPDMIYVREYIRESKHQSYPWDDNKILVVLVVPGHQASGLEVRQLSEQPDSYWRRISISFTVTLAFLFSIGDIGGMGGFIFISVFLFFLLLAAFRPLVSDALFEKINLNNSSDVESQTVVLEGDGRACPTDVQDLSRHEMLPALEQAEAEIRGHLQLLPERNLGAFEQDLLTYYARCKAPSAATNNSEPAGKTLVQATAVIAQSNSEELGDFEMATGSIEELPLLPAKPVGNDSKM